MKCIGHRDLKPPNIFIVPDPTLPGQERVKLLDFGVAKVRFEDSDRKNRTRAGALVGTLAYMSPEQRIDSSQVDPKSDVYSLGLILYEMLSGRLTAVRPSLGKAVPGRLDNLIASMQVEDPRQRPTAREVASELKQLDEQRVDAGTVRRPILVGAAVLAGIAMSTLAVVLLRPRPDNKREAPIKTVEARADRLLPLPSAAVPVPRGMIPFAGARLSGDTQPFALDRDEVTNVEFARMVGQRAALRFDDQRYLLRQGSTVLADLHPVTGGMAYSDGAVRPLVGADRRPAVQVSWFGADLYCRAQGKRLPTETEWELAARGPKRDRRYPWGSRSPACSQIVFGRGPQNSRQAAQCPGHGPDDVGTADQDVTFEGVHDLGGNVAEWTASIALGAAGVQQRVVRGGDWTRPVGAIQGSSRSPSAPEHVAPTVGFRCAKSLSDPP